MRKDAQERAKDKLSEAAEAINTATTAYHKEIGKAKPRGADVALEVTRMCEGVSAACHAMMALLEALGE